jgi:hypothetical protein
MSLIFADFLNSLNNFISGFLVAGGFKLTPGIGCTINGFIGQFSVQAADFSTLAIAITTFLALNSQKNSEKVMNRISKYLPWILAFVWITPLITASIAHFWVGYAPVGNWCWISKNAVARYTLGHGIRVVYHIFINVRLCF